MIEQAATIAGRTRRARDCSISLCVVAMLAVGGAASAQLAPGVSGRSSLSYMDSGETMRTLVVFGTCYADRNSEGAWSLVATEPGSRQEADTYRRLFRTEIQPCLGEGTELQLPIAYTRGAIVEGLFKRGIAVPEALVALAPVPGSPVRTLSEAARCYTATHREHVRALVEETRPGSREEHAALSEMAPDFFRCVPETAAGRQFNSTQIRFRLAEALLRMSSPSAPSSASAAER